MSKKVDYSKGLVYKLCCKDPEITDEYVGSTTSLRHRKGQHKQSTEKEGNAKYHRKVYQFIRDNGGWNNWDMIMLEEYPCENKLQLEKRERYYIEQLRTTLNMCVPTRTDKEYREDNKCIISERKKKCYENKKEQYRQHHRQYRIENRDKINAQKRQKYRESRDN